MTPGLFGKLPAHGDFVARGWDAATVAAVDGWLMEGVAAVRAASGEDGFAGAMAAGPLWHHWLPPGVVGEQALHGVLTPTVDSAGRLFLLLAGVAGEAAASWAVASQAPGFAEAVEAAAYEALAGGLDADGLQARIADAVPAVDARAHFLAGLSLPGEAAFWVAAPAEGAPLGMRRRGVDAGVLCELVSGGARTCG
ncbi:type VI secretion system-associated protein TagF [Sandaracinobacteroides saxicola]|uniref:Type VI secretion system-associated protein TagF n=1 Tax=Sandaracinobacteroides saxicola TaxID=2759707 RepID=A0A7G5IJ16_9SPHN|nr:type VI secretion system-associated protein TagF [Sandaracinobacteroides saxicola]QMW23358.1 type VI secretion system-associated protein TagF [Sandaracinobacteroides saxicola]